MDIFTFRGILRLFKLNNVIGKMWLCCTFHNSCQHWGCNLWQEVIISFMGSQVKNTVNDCYEEQSSGSLVVYQVGNSCNKTITRHLLLFSISKYLLSDDKGRGDNWVFSPPTTGCQAPITVWLPWEASTCLKCIMWVSQHSGKQELPSTVTTGANKYLKWQREFQIHREPLPTGGCERERDQRCHRAE